MSTKASERKRKIRDDAFEKASKHQPVIKKSKRAQNAARKAASCGARKRTGGRCMMAAGWGTSHPGIGTCKLHGGAAPNHVKAAAKAELRLLLGKEMEINPFEAIMWCIRIRAGEVEWLSNEISRLEQAAWVEETLVGKQFHLFARERQAAMNDLVRFSQIAISMGIAERYVRLAEVYGHTIAKLIQDILGDPELKLTGEQKAVAPKIVRRHLLLIKSNETQVIDAEAKELPEKTAA